MTYPAWPFFDSSGAPSASQADVIAETERQYRQWLSDLPSLAREFTEQMAALGHEYPATLDSIDTYGLAVVTRRGMDGDATKAPAVWTTWINMDAEWSPRGLDLADGFIHYAAHVATLTGDVEWVLYHDPKYPTDVRNLQPVMKGYTNFSPLDVFRRAVGFNLKDHQEGRPNPSPSQLIRQRIQQSKNPPAPTLPITEPEVELEALWEDDLDTDDLPGLFERLLHRPKPEDAEEGDEERYNAVLAVSDETRHELGVDLELLYTVAKDTRGITDVFAENKDYLYITLTPRALANIDATTDRITTNLKRALKQRAHDR